MLPYTFVFLLFALFYFKNKAQTLAPFYILLVVLSLFIGVRDMIGGFDVYIYAAIYESSNMHILSFEAFEYGYRLYNIILRYISEDRHFMFVFTAFLTVSVHFFILKKYSSFLYISLYIYFCKFCLMQFIYLRQLLAMAVLWLSITYIIKRKIAWFLAFVIIAIQFHISSLIFLPVYFLYNRKFNPPQMFLLTVISIIIAITPLGNFMFGFMGDSIDNEKLQHYANINTGFNIFYFIELILIYVLILKFKNHFYKTNYGSLIVNGMLFYICISAIALTNANFVRFSWFPFLFVIIGLGNIYNFIQSSKKKLTYRLIFFLYFGLLFFRLVIVLDSGDYMPYKAFFQDIERTGKFDWMEYRRE